MKLRAAEEVVQIESGVNVEINADENVHIGDGGTREVIIRPAGVLYLKYRAGQLDDWAGDAPEYVWQALDRLAAALVASGHKP